MEGPCGFVRKSDLYLPITIFLQIPNGNSAFGMGHFPTDSFDCTQVRLYSDLSEVGRIAFDAQYDSEKLDIGAGSPSMAI
jgi:hypothetical protein